MPSPVTCPHCGSAATLPLPGLGDTVTAVFGLAFAQRGPDLSFNNPDLVQKFMAGQIDAVCKACRKRFSSQARPMDMPAAPPAHSTRPAAERLRELERLRAENLLTDDEYRAKRAEILRSL